jgi:hypothetical protein
MAKPNPKKTPKAVMAWGIHDGNGNLDKSTCDTKSQAEMWTRFIYESGEVIRVRITPVRRKKKV